MFTRFARVGVWVCIALVLLTGCMKKAPVAPAPQSTSLMKPEEVQSDMEREMVILFQGLVQMDRQERLVINKKQAEELLPAVKRNTYDGELNPADQQMIIGILTADQRLFVIKYQKDIHEHMQASKERKEREKLDHEERERMVREFQQRRQDEEHGQRSEPSEPSNSSEETSTGPASVVPSKRSNNVEQRLIRLLESKLKDDETR